MERQTILEQFDTWPVEEQKTFVGQLIDRMNDPVEEAELDGDLKKLLDERLAAADAKPEDSYSWDEVLTYLRRDR